ncbi:Takl2 [Drosophila busckii]|uniref:Takl2 n=1 Tax=Drosophila busckii TaxID=30019 RepID=A0A0M4EDR3_DROBS|nr:mitogen-activated protein kinase kinase kinase 7 [Drosophila busckii]ALC45991.1 Takl2 [Drosophila busckii]
MDSDTINFAQITLGIEIGKGTFGKVYKAKWLNKDVAVKKIYLGVDEEVTRREFQLLSRANHENIIFLHGISLHDHNTYLIMEYMDGGSLSDFLHVKKTKYDLRHIFNWARQCAEAVAYLHSKTPKCVIHRDLKPLNLLLNDSYRCLKVCDFGSVRYLASSMSAEAGTVEYMAPEVISGRKYTEKCDVFSWSIILWEMLSREQPYKHIANKIDKMKEIQQGLRPELDKIQYDNVPESVSQLMTDGWSLEADKRPTMDNIITVFKQFTYTPEELIL